MAYRCTCGDHVFHAAWSDEDQQFVATVEAFPSLSWLADTELDAVRGLHDLVLEVEVDLDGGAGASKTFDTTEDFLNHLDTPTP